MSAKLKPYEGGDDDFDPIKILLRGQDEWNPWRARNLGYLIDFQGVDLNGARLTGVNLSEADLSEADLSQANLRRANLRSGKLTKANLSEANLSEANLNEADLTDADLSRSNLRGGRLRKAGLSNANLHGANLSGAILSGANLIGADLSEANLSKTDLKDANLSGANLSRVIFRGTKLKKANLSGANLCGADLSEADFSEANLSGAKLRNAKLPLLTKLSLSAKDSWLVARHNWLKKPDWRALVVKLRLAAKETKGGWFKKAETLRGKFGGIDSELVLETGCEETSINVVRIEQFRIFTESSSIEDAEILYNSAKALYEALGFTIEREGDWRKGSLWRNAFARLKGLAEVQRGG